MSQESTTNQVIIEHAGATYTINPWTPATMKNFADFVRRQAWDSFAEIRGHIPEEEATECRRALLQMGGSGEFEFGSATVQARLTTLDGIKKSLQVLLTDAAGQPVGEATVDAILAEQLASIMGAMQQSPEATPAVPGTSAVA